MLYVALSLILALVLLVSAGMKLASGPAGRAALATYGIRGEPLASVAWAALGAVEAGLAVCLAAGAEGAAWATAGLFAAFTAAHPRLVKDVLRSADEIISLSEETSAICRRYVPADRVHLVPNALEQGTPREKTRTVVFGGVVSHRKGVDVLQKAWAKVEGKEGWRLLVAGPPREPEVVDRGVPGIEFLGSLENALLDFPGCAVVISHDRWFLDRVVTHILAYEGTDENPAAWYWFEGNFESYEKNKVERLGADAARPHRVTYRKLTRD